MDITDISTDLTPTPEDLIESFRNLVLNCSGDLKTLTKFEEILNDEIDRASSKSGSASSDENDLFESLAESDTDDKFSTPSFPKAAEQSSFDNVRDTSGPNTISTVPPNAEETPALAPNTLVLPEDTAAPPIDPSNPPDIEDITVPPDSVDTLLPVVHNEDVPTPSNIPIINDVESPLQALVDFRHEHYSSTQLLSVRSDVETLFQHNNTKYVWLSQHKSTYSFGNRTLSYIDIQNSKHISTMMQNLNEEFGLTLDSCLLSRYMTGSDATSRHQDNEDLIDQDHAICNVSIGSPRDIQFWSSPNEKAGALIHHINMHEGSLVIMHPGCQQKLWHNVLPGVPGQRFCLSFRRSTCQQDIPLSPVISNVFPATLAQSTPLAKSTTKFIPLPPPRPLKNGFPESFIQDHMKTHGQNSDLERKYPTHLVIGDSLVKGLKVPDSVHICKGGIHPSQVLQLLPGSCNILPPEQYNNIQTLTLVVGTNAINVTGYSDPIPLLQVIHDYENLVNDLKKLFPNARIGLFNIIPRSYTCRETLHRIEIFNSLFSQHVAHTWNNVVWIKLYWEFVNMFGYLKPELYGRMGLHLSFRGKKLMRHSIINFQQGYY